MEYLPIAFVVSSGLVITYLYGVQGSESKINSSMNNSKPKLVDFKTVPKGHELSKMIKSIQEDVSYNKRITLIPQRVELNNEWVAHPKRYVVVLKNNTYFYIIGDQRIVEELWRG